MKHERFIVVAGLVVAAALVVAVVLWSARDHSSVVRFGYSNSELSALIFVADEKGFFKNHGIQPEFVHYGDAPSALGALRGNAVDFALTPDFTAAAMSFSVPKLRIIASVGVSRRVQLVMRADRGYHSIRDLRGKTIALVPLSQAEFELHQLLRSNGMTENDVTVVHDSPSGVRDQMVNGSVDAVVIWDPFIWEIQKKFGEQIITQNAQFFGRTLWLAATTDEFLRQMPIVASEVLAALRDAEQFAGKNPEVVQAYLAKKFNLSPDYLVFTLKKIDWHVVLDSDLAEILDYEIQWWAKYALQSRIQTLPRADQLIDKNAR